jgi:hypothetical protein
VTYLSAWAGEEILDFTPDSSRSFVVVAKTRNEDPWDLPVVGWARFKRSEGEIDVCPVVWSDVEGSMQFSHEIGGATYLAPCSPRRWVEAFRADAE